MQMPMKKKPYGGIMEGVLNGGYQTPPYAPDRMEGMEPMPGLGGQPENPKGMFAQGSKGQIIAGVLGDALAQIGGGDPVFMQSQMQQRLMDQQNAQWGLRRQQGLQDFEQQQRIRAQYDVSPMQRDVQAWGMMTPEQRAAYQEMQDARSGPITTTLPNGQLYVGPKSGLPAALGAGAAPTAPLRPVGKLRPVGGSGGNVGGGFR